MAKINTNSPHIDEKQQIIKYYSPPSHLPGPSGLYPIPGALTLISKCGKRAAVFFILCHKCLSLREKSVIIRERLVTVGICVKKEDRFVNGEVDLLYFAQQARAVFRLILIIYRTIHHKHPRPVFLGSKGRSSSEKSVPR